MGRRPRTVKINYTTLTCNLPTELAHKFQAYSERQVRSASGQMCVLIQQALNQEEKENADLQRNSIPEN